MRCRSNAAAAWFSNTPGICKDRTLKRGKWTTLIGVGALALLTLSSCHKKEEGHGHEAAEHGHEEEEEEPQLILSRPIRQDTTVLRDYVCQIRSCRNIEIRALERGYLEKVNVQEGQKVNEGDLMFKVLPRVFSASVKRAEAEAQVAKVEYENTERLQQTNVVSDKEVTMAKAKWDKALADVSLAQTHLNFTDIKAPFSGLMDRLRLRNGSLVDAGDLLTTLSDNSEMWVYFNVPEADYLDYSSRVATEESKQVKLVMANGKIFDQPGRVNVIEAEFNNKTGTIPFRADFKNPTGLLRHGETGNIRMQETVKNALLVPQKATFESLNHHFVYVVDKDDMIHQKKITITHELEDLFIIGDEGVTENDTIILEGLRQVHDNMKAPEHVFEEPKEAYGHLKLKAE